MGLLPKFITKQFSTLHTAIRTATTTKDVFDKEKAFHVYVLASGSLGYTEDQVRNALRDRLVEGASQNNWRITLKTLFLISHVSQLMEEGNESPDSMGFSVRYLIMDRRQFGLRGLKEDAFIGKSTKLISEEDSRAIPFVKAYACFVEEWMTCVEQKILSKDTSSTGDIAKHIRDLSGLLRLLNAAAASQQAAKDTQGYGGSEFNPIQLLCLCDTVRMACKATQRLLLAASSALQAALTIRPSASVGAALQRALVESRRLVPRLLADSLAVRGMVERSARPGEKPPYDVSFETVASLEARVGDALSRALDTLERVS